MRIRDLVAVSLLFVVAAGWQAYGQSMGGAGIDLSPYALKTEVPKPASTVPPSDVFGGAVGSDVNTFARADAARPRITRSMLVTMAADGTAIASWAAQPLAAGGVVNLTPVYSGVGVPKCWVTTEATTISVPIKCVVENTGVLNLSVITSGLLLNASGSGLKVNVVVLPPSQ